MSTSVACCTIPPVHSKYTPKGVFKPYGQFNRVYLTGPDTSENAIVCVYDIFGYFPQTQQGADILASTLKTTVFMPDVFGPNKPFPIEKFPPKTPEQKAELQAFFATTANPSKAIDKIIAFGNDLKAKGRKKIGLYGFCWGGKVTVVSGRENTPFSSVAIVHPAMLSAEDAQKLTVPLAIYISKDESLEEYNKVLHVLSKKPFAAENDHKRYPNMFHGWAAARGNLEDPDNKREYEDVYSRLAAFFHKTV
ncbi:Alpha/Beta hydrolase fold [Amanita muscaria]